MSNSLWPHGLYPNRLLCPWGSPGKNSEWLSISYSRWSSWPRDQAQHLLCWQADSLPLSYLGSHWKVIVAVQLLSCVRLFVTPWTAACQASPSITVSWSLLKFMSIEKVLIFLIKEVGNWCYREVQKHLCHWLPRLISHIRNFTHIQRIIFYTLALWKEQTLKHTTPSLKQDREREMFLRSLSKE